jgi:HAD superfamily hydrolase (TIGR01484 family)
LIDTAIILAGGLGTRLRPLTDNTPKPLLPMKGKPIIQHTIEQLRDHGIKNIILSIGFKAEKIKEYFGDGKQLGVNISYSIEEEPLGTGGAIKKSCNNITEPVFVVWGDNLMDINYTQLVNNHRKNNAEITMVLTSREDVEHFGVAKLEENKIISFVEKPNREDAPSNLINAGAIALNPSSLSILPEGKSSIEYDCYEKLAPLGKISYFKHQGQWFPTDTLEKYRDACLTFTPDIDFTKKRIIIADVDETICDSCQEISDEMAHQINSLIKKGFHFAFISGTTVKELQRMISSKVIEAHHILGTTGTNYTFVNNQGNNSDNNQRTKEIYNHSFTDEEKKNIFTVLEKLITQFNIQSMTTKEDQLQDRDSQITLSAIGRNASLELKKKYDPDGLKRKEWINFIKEELNDYELKIGGTTSLDVTRKGLDKAWGIKEFAKYYNLPLNEIIYFGDKLYPGGNDYAASKIVDCVAVKSPEDTLKELRRLYHEINLVSKGVNKSNQVLINKSIKVDRPWGSFEQFIHNEPSTVKIIEVEPNKRLSLQSHQYREEMWIALDDGIITEIGENKKILKKGEKVFIPKNTKHRLASENNKVRVLEISLGDFDENDIERYEDDFGRA